MRKIRSYGSVGERGGKEPLYPKVEFNNIIFKHVGSPDKSGQAIRPIKNKLYTDETKKEFLHSGEAGTVTRPVLKISVLTISKPVN